MVSKDDESLLDAEVADISDDEDKVVSNLHPGNTINKGL